MTFITLSIQTNEFMLHFKNNAIRIQSENNIKIIKDILQIRETYLKIKDQMQVYLQKQKTLENCFQDGEKKHFFHHIFSPKNSTRKSTGSLQNPQSFSTVKINQKNFALVIGKKIYQMLYQNTELLYISGNLGFRFLEKNYDFKEINLLKIIYSKPGRIKILMRKIPKINEQFTLTVRNLLIQYRIDDFREQIWFALETQTHFEVISPLYEQKYLNCDQMIQANIHITEESLRNIFYKLKDEVDKQSRIMYSISPENIYLGSSGGKISLIFCLLKNFQNTAYISPQELMQCKNQTKQAINLVNLWKIGMLLYQMAYGRPPFPVEYLAYIIKHEKTLKIRFPSSQIRTTGFQNFINSMLQINPIQRAGDGVIWHKKILEHQWIQNFKA